ncbi:MAG: amidohydrolase family protein [Kiritimatiellae bacterium]|nr:amidohydrolase family protein [Kiritimatiellia bacterium]
MKIIDAHVHLGDTPKDTAPGIKRYPASQMREELDAVGASGAVVMAFPEDMYRILDTPEWRNRSNAYCLETAKREHDVYPFYFVWTDYLIPDDLGQYAGIKWHRHDNEPRYDYASPKCREFLKQIRRFNLPVQIEEEYDPTHDFVKNNPDLTIIIPHIGESTGPQGTERMGEFFKLPNVYFDTAITNFEVLKRAYETVGPERLIFGTDSSACRPVVDNYLPTAIARHRRLNLPDRELELIFSGNIERLLAGWRKRVARH